MIPFSPLSESLSESLSEFLVRIELSPRRGKLLKSAKELLNARVIDGLIASLLASHMGRKLTAV